MPQAIYDYCRSTDGASPVRVRDDVIMHTDRQIHAYLLCGGCEHILNEGGEQWVNPKLATMQKTFPLYALLMKSHAAFTDENSGMYYAAANPEISVEKLSHFALGIFWKAGVHSWSGSTKEPMIDLGQYAAMIRTWLRGETAFPDWNEKLPARHLISQSRSSWADRKEALAMRSKREKEGGSLKTCP